MKHDDLSHDGSNEMCDPLCLWPFRGASLFAMRMVVLVVRRLARE